MRSDLATNDRDPEIDQTSARFTASVLAAGADLLCKGKARMMAEAHGHNAGRWHGLNRGRKGMRTSTNSGTLDFRMLGQSKRLCIVEGDGVDNFNILPDQYHRKIAGRTQGLQFRRPAVIETGE